MKILEWNMEGAQIRKPITNLQNSDTKKVHSLSDIDIGLITKVDCNRILDVKSIFEDTFLDESSETYGLYKEKLLKLLASELDGGGYSDSLDLLYNRWKTMDNVAMSRGYRILLTDHWVNREFSRVIQTLLRIIPSRFVTDIYSFEIAMRAINRAYIDGWVLSLVLISVMKSFGIEYFKRVSVFRDFSKPTVDEIGEFKNAKSKYKRNLGYELHDTNKKRSECMDSLYNHAMYSCFHSRKFVTLMSLYFEKLAMNHLINAELDSNYKLHLNEHDKRQLKEFLENHDNQIGSGFDELVADSLSLVSNIDVSYDFDVIQNYMVSLKSLETTQMKSYDWSIYLILKHSLSNIFSTNEIIVTNPDSSDETMTKFGENDSKLNSLLERRTNLDDIVSYLRDLLTFISKQTFFCKNRSRFDAEKSLESTIHYIRGFETSSRLLGVVDLYESLRLLLRHNVSGATALNMMFMLVPKLVFSNWCHYHMFLCCIEHDFERGDIESIDELLQYMIKLNCIPDAGLYERYFGMCNSLDKPLLVMKHFDIICENGINWEERDRYTSQKKIRISFGLYEQIFISCLKTGNVESGTKAMKNLLGALRGSYKLIPSSIWKSFTKLMEVAQVDKSLTAILNQISNISTPVQSGMITPISVEIPRHKSVIIKQIEGILDKYINSS
ncbi:hypothetical protein MACK_002157 [Theileria orientalis]|uniref:Uncharacterized protein n=1 Tax=Theileria orientalis TaxID=68886 RepID=A0A976MBT0_THEOR|nr:hypothetical protein MACK_002157 [Theileria orientalis]